MNYNKIAFTGAHRTGKSTLAKELASFMEIPYLPMNLSSAPFWEENGWNCSDNFDFFTRLLIQEQIFYYFESQLNKFSREHPDGWITDRSYIDIIGYMLANLDPKCSHEYDDRILNLVHDCELASIMMINYHVMVKPGLPLVGDKSQGKSGNFYLSKSYQQAIHNIIYGVLSTIRRPIFDYTIIANEKNPKDVAFDIFRNIDFVKRGNFI